MAFILTSTRPKGLCLTCELEPILVVSRVFGINAFKPCNCYASSRYQNGLSTLYSLYSSIIELYMWINAIRLIPQGVAKETICSSWILVYTQDVRYIMELFAVTIAIYSAIQFSVMRRRKLSASRNKDTYVHKISFRRIMKIFQFSYFFLLFFSIFFLLLTYILIIHPVWMKESRNEMEAYSCTAINLIWSIYIAGQMLSLLFQTTISIHALTKTYSNLSADLGLLKGTNNEDLQKLLELLVETHSDLWLNYIQQSNQLWGNLLPLAYASAVYIACFLAYAVYFGNISPMLRLQIGLLSALVLSGCLTVAWVVSILTSHIYGNFISIGRFSSSNIRLEKRLKFMNFMKRFGKTPIGFSMAGFFFVKKTFLIRMASGLESAFSTIVKLKQVNHQRECNLEMEKNFTALV